MAEASDKTAKKTLNASVAIWTLRTIVGLTFIVSGLSKAIDPWGFLFKIEEYLLTWGIDIPRSAILVGAIGLSAYEFLCGLFLASGCFKRVAPWLLTASMVFMLPLTAYIVIANPVDDCGCFGDFLKLSNWATFIKNILLTAALVYLCKANRCVTQSLFAPSLQWVVGVVSFVYLLAISLFGYNIQPMIDFRSYPVGTQLADIEGNADDSSPMTFIYEKDGRQEIFDIDNLPDSTWTFIDRVTKNDSDGKVVGFSIFDGDTDVTEQVITSDGEQLLLVIPEPDRIDISYTYAINQLASRINRDGGEMTGLLATAGEGIERWTDLSMADYPCYTVEDTSLKELARGTMSMVYLRGGEIKWKRTLSSFEFHIIEEIERGEVSFDLLAINGHRMFALTTLVWAAILVIIAMSQIIHRLLCRKNRKKDVNLQKETETTYSNNQYNSKQHQ